MISLLGNTARKPSLITESDFRLLAAKSESERNITSSNPSPLDAIVC